MTKNLLTYLTITVNHPSAARLRIEESQEQIAWRPYTEIAG